MVDSENHLRTVVVRGTIVEKRGPNEGANEHINKLAKKYMGCDRYSVRDGETRVLLRIKPTHVQEPGGEGGSRWRSRQITGS